MKFKIKPRQTAQLWPSRATGWEPLAPCNFFSIDPGLSGTGWALWDRKRFRDLCPPLASGVVYPRWKVDDAELPWHYVAQRLAVEVVYALRVHRQEATTFYVEEPQFMESQTGMVAARRGDLMKLVTFYGALLGASGGPGSFSFIPVPIPEWKGDMDKELTKHRVLKRLPRWQPTSKATHEIDAVGIGLYVKGHF